MNQTDYDPEKFDVDGYGNLIPKNKLPTVDIIASGYEWICPECGRYQREIEGTETVICNDVIRISRTIQRLCIKQNKQH